MKANELMIGDWVMVNDIEHTHPLQVAEIFKKCGAYYATLYWNGMPDNVNPETLTSDVEKVLPISLTPEILEKNGFEYKEGETGMYGVTIAPHYICDGVPFEVFCDGEPFAIWFKEPVNIKFVHQLQHALRLCGIKKEIEL